MVDDQKHAPHYQPPARTALRAKVKRGAKRWCSYRRGYCARAPMWPGAEGGTPASFTEQLR